MFCDLGFSKIRKVSLADRNEKAIFISSANLHGKKKSFCFPLYFQGIYLKTHFRLIKTMKPLMFC